MRTRDESMGFMKWWEDHVGVHPLTKYEVGEAVWMAHPVIADAERYKRDRDEAVEVLREAGETLGSEMPHEEERVSKTIAAFLTRIEQADKGVGDAFQGYGHAIPPDRMKVIPPGSVGEAMRSEVARVLAPGNVDVILDKAVSDE